METAGPPGQLDLPTPRQQQDHAISMIIKEWTVDQGLGPLGQLPEH